MRAPQLLRELKALAIVYEQGFLPEPAFFKHAVIQDVAYQSLLVQRRKELHRAVGYAIEDLYPDRLADPWTASGSSAASFAVGAALPVVAGTVVHGSARLVLIVVVALVSLAALGALGARVGGGVQRRASLRVLVGGGLAMGASILIGHFVGTVV